MPTNSLTIRPTIFHRHTTLLLVGFFSIRLLSFGLRQAPVAQGVLVAIALITAIILFIKKPRWAWYLLLGELLFGGAGHFLELFGVSIRTLLLVTFLTCWLTYSLARKTGPADGHNFQFLIPIALIFWATIGSLHALEYDRSGAAIIADLIPYAFFLLLLPALSWKPDEAQKKFLLRLAAAFLIGSALFSLITFILFSTGVEMIQDPYYKWFRDVAFGKITDMGSGFWRIVTPEHLLVAPMMIVIGSWVMGSKTDKINKRASYTLLASGALILALNLSRTYFLALLVAFLVLKYKHHWKEWLKASLTSAALIFVLFTSIHLIASSGNLGWDLLGLRFGSIARPALEESAFTRTVLLPPIWQLIKIHPIIGTGLGASITFTHPATGEAVTTRHFDWGYLELWAELGLVGILLFLTLLVRAGIALVKKIKQGSRQASKHQDLYIGFLAVLAALAVMNITAPVLFHVLGVVVLVFIIVLIKLSPAAREYE